MSLVEAIPPRKLIGAASPEYWKGAPNPWTEERVNQLTELWKDGLSAGHIALQLGVGLTRNAILGKVHRLKLADRGDIKPHAKAGNRFTNRRPDSFRRKALPKKPLVAKPALTSAEFIATIERSKAACSFADLGPGMCRYPYGEPSDADFAFCGRHATGTYCAGHHRIAYRRPS